MSWENYRERKDTEHCRPQQNIAIEQKRRPTLRERNPKRTRQVVSCLSSVLDRKELTQLSEHRCTKLLYMLFYLILFVVQKIGRMALKRNEGCKNKTVLARIIIESGNQWNKYNSPVPSIQLPCYTSTLLTYLRLSDSCICSRYCMNSCCLWGGRLATASMIDLLLLLLLLLLLFDLWFFLTRRNDKLSSFGTSMLSFYCYCWQFISRRHSLHHHHPLVAFQIRQCAKVLVAIIGQAQRNKLHGMFLLSCVCFCGQTLQPLPTRSNVWCLIYIHTTHI